MQIARTLISEFLNHEEDSEFALDFLHHLSSPVDEFEDEHLHESYSDSVKKSLAHPKAKTILDVSHKGQTKGGNLWKAMQHGLRSADAKISAESPDERKAGLKAARSTWNEFAQARGYKSGMEMSEKRNGKIQRLSTKLAAGNQKTEKSEGGGVLTTGINLAPHTTAGLDGVDVCPKSSSDCRANCLGTESGGNRRFPHSLASKMLRTHFLVHHPEEALRMIDDEVAGHARRAGRAGLTPGFRLNITSDISWEKAAPGLFTRHPDVQFYDYTKLANRVGHPNLPANYHLTLSHTGTGHDESNDREVTKALHGGQTVAMVFSKAGKTPTHVEDVKTGHRFPVVDGDKDDNTFDRHTEAGLVQGTPGHGVVSALKLKGVTAASAGKFVTPVDDDWIARINR